MSRIAPLAGRRQKGDKMGLPPLYKYLDVQGAKLTLGNQSFKHAKPSDFNDTEDLTIQSIFPEDIETALKRASGGMLDVILTHLEVGPDLRVADAGTAGGHSGGVAGRPRSCTAHEGGYRQRRPRRNP